jgi:polysaccharide biosynthesis protein PslH
MEKKLKILQLSPQLPFPAENGGKIGIANILKQFRRQGCEVTFFTYNNGNLSKEGIAEAEKYCRLLLFNHSLKNTYPRIIKSLIQGKSIYIEKYSSPEIIEFLSKEIETNHYDIIHADHTGISKLALLLGKRFNIPVGIRLHNIETIIWQRYFENLPFYSPKRYYIYQQSNILASEEAKLINSADICFSITEDDKQRALKLAPEANVMVASAGVDLDQWNVDHDINRNHFEIILATYYVWKHNVDGLKWFIQHVMPIIKSELHEATLTLLGESPPKWLNDYKDLGVNVVGYVPSVKPYYNRANVFIVPLFVGGGIRIKILEAMAMELPVVATNVAAEGISASQNEGLFISDDSKQFAQKIIELCNNFQLARDLGEKARLYVTNNFSWEKNVKKMIDGYHEILKKNN